MSHQEAPSILAQLRRELSNRGLLVFSEADEREARQNAARASAHLRAQGLEHRVLEGVVRVQP
jgi:hypothetical protein